MAKKPEDATGPFFEAFQNFGRGLKLPSVTVEDVVEHHRKNIQAWQEAAKNTSEGAQAIMGKQREALENTLADITGMVEKARKGGMTQENARDVMSSQMEFTKRSFDATIKNATEIGAILRDTNKQNFDVLKNRVQESIEEIKTNMDRDGDDDSPVKPA